MSQKEFFNEDQNGKISLNNYAFKIFLENNQFSKHKPNDNSTFNLIKKDGIFLKIKDDWEIKDFVLDFIILDMTKRKRKSSTLACEFLPKKYFSKNN